MISTRRQDSWKIILLFFVPAVLIWITAMVIPFFYGIWISFTKWDGIGSNYTLVGLANYTKLFTNAKFWLSLERTAWYTVGVVILSNVVGLGLGLLLTSALKGRNLFRTAIFIPNVIGGVAMGYIWKYIFAYGVTLVGSSPGSPVAGHLHALRPHQSNDRNDTGVLMAAERLSDDHLRCGFYQCAG